MKKKAGGSVRSVQIQSDEGQITEYTSQKMRWRRQCGVKSTESGFIWQNRPRSVKAIYEESLATWPTQRLQRKYWRVAINRQRTCIKAPWTSLMKSPEYEKLSQRTPSTALLNTLFGERNGRKRGRKHHPWSLAYTLAIILPARTRISYRTATLCWPMRRSGEAILRLVGSVLSCVC